MEISSGNYRFDGEKWWAKSDDNIPVPANTWFTPVLNDLREAVEHLKGIVYAGGWQQRADARAFLDRLTKPEKCPTCHGPFVFANGMDAPKKWVSEHAGPVQTVRQKVDAVFRQALLDNSASARCVRILADAIDEIK